MKRNDIYLWAAIPKIKIKDLFSDRKLKLGYFAVNRASDSRVGVYFRWRNENPVILTLLDKDTKNS